MKISVWKPLWITLLLIAVMIVQVGCGGSKTVKPSAEQEAPKQAAVEKPAVEAKQAPPAAPKAAPSNQPKMGGTLTIGLEKAISVMNPQVDTKSVNQNVRELMYESLVDYDDKLNLKPQLAERWELSPDGKTYTFQLRKGVKFHNGSDMKAADVKWTIDYVMDPKNAAYGRPFFDKVQAVEAVNDSTLKITLKEATSVFLSYLASIQSFAVVPAGSLETGVDKPQAFPPGTGPFKFNGLKGDDITAVRFADYWGQKAYLDNIVLKVSPDPDVRFTALRAGDLDMIERSPYQWVRKIVDGEIKGFGMSEATVSGFRRLVFNVAAPPFNNVKVRQAVAQAMDKKEILAAAYWGFGTPTNEKMLQGSFWHLNVPENKRDVAKAKQLLQEAGLSNVEVKLMARKGNELEAQVLQQQLGEAGIKVEIQILEAGTYTERQRNGDFQFMLYGGSTDPDPATTYIPDLMTEQQAKQGKRGSNVAGYSDPEMDRLLTALAMETDPNKRKETYTKMVNKLWNDLPEIYIGFVPRFYLYKENIKGFSAEPQGAFVFTGGGLNYTWIDK